MLSQSWLALNAYLGAGATSHRGLWDVDLPGDIHYGFARDGCGILNHALAHSLLVHKQDDLHKSSFLCSLLPFRGPDKCNKLPPQLGKPSIVPSLYGYLLALSSASAAASAPPAALT